MLTSTIATLRRMNATSYGAEADYRLVWSSYARECPILATMGPDATRAMLMAERTYANARDMADRLNRLYGYHESTSSAFEVRRIR
jgi:hypothetical protein